MSQWAFKIRRYDGSDSVLDICQSQTEAEDAAAFMNGMEQTDQYYAEAWRTDD